MKIHRIIDEDLTLDEMGERDLREYVEDHEERKRIWRGFVVGIVIMGLISLVCCVGISNEMAKQLVKDNQQLYCGVK
jgi:hypothetical protein